MHPVALLGAVTVLWPKGLNTSYYLDINAFARQTAWAHGFMHDYALWLGLVLMVLLFLAAYLVVWWRRNARGAALLGLGGIGTLIALGLNQLVGHAARELRPYDTYHHALVLVGKANDYAFPSDHAVVAGALAASVLLVVGRGVPDLTQRAHSEWRGTGPSPARATPVMAVLVGVAAVLGLFLCFARVYVGAHYPGDVVAGFLLGAAVVATVSLARPVAYRAADLVADTALAVIVRRPGEDWQPVRAPGSERRGSAASNERGG